MQTFVPPTGPWAVRSQRFIRRFYVAALLISFITVASLLAHEYARYTQGDGYAMLRRRAVAQADVTLLAKRDEECRLVHNAADKCAFIKANCPDEEAGLISYLSLYYCNLKDAQPVAFFILIVWICLLFSTIGIAASDFFCVNLSTIAGLLGMSESMAGVTFLAFGNGSPDVFSTFAAMSTHSGSLAVGELMGAAGFITAVVAGSMALVREFKVGKKTFIRDVCFFIVAASFSTSFLADGHLYLWECIVMVAFYIFYVVVVVVWHWYFGKKQKQRERESAARSHVYTPGVEDIEVPELDENEEPGEASGLLGSRQSEDWAQLERGLYHKTPEEEDEGGEGLALATEMSNSMRVTRPLGVRRNTLTPIRPSLVGALEFRSVLSSLQRSRSIQAPPIHLRRYSDDHTPSRSPFPQRYTDNPEEEADDEVGPLVGLSVQRVSGRGRAVSMNAAGEPSEQDPAAYSVAEVPQVGVIAATPMLPSAFEFPEQPQSKDKQKHHAVPASPTISISPPPSIGSRPPSFHTSTAELTPDGHSDVDTRSPSPFSQPTKHDTLEVPGQHYFQAHPPRTKELVERPRLLIPQQSDSANASTSSSPIMQFPAYMDSPLPLSSQSSRAPSLHLPEPSIAAGSEFTHADFDEIEAAWVLKWWPYRYLPNPQVLVSTLFPTLYMWRSKSLWDKFIGILSAPSIFLLSVTLPVVDLETGDEDEEEEEEPVPVTSEPRSVRSATRSRAVSSTHSPLISPAIESRMEPEWHQYRRSTISQRSASSRRASIDSRGLAGHGNTAEVAVLTEEHHHHSNSHDNSYNSMHPQSKRDSRPEISRVEAANQNPHREWNRWLIITQIFTAPWFVVSTIWVNSDSDLRQYVLLLLYSCIGSLVALGILLTTTTADKPPKYRSLLSFFGFVVSIAWISSIANEVVGVLKAFGVILGISDAILGLTIFAVGNSLGDLVADITVARLGYPVMALSACFGGPMLNILLGIGLSGVYMTTTKAQHKHEKHPSRPIEYRPYEIEVSPTLIISAIALVVTLVCLLIMVPLSNWIMTRRIGIILIGLWIVSTIVNLVVEATGILDNANLTLF